MVVATSKSPKKYLIIVLKLMLLSITRRKVNESRLDNANFFYTPFFGKEYLVFYYIRVIKFMDVGIEKSFGQEIR